MLDKEKHKIDTEFKLNVERTRNSMLISDFEALDKLMVAKLNLSVMLGIKDEIDYGRKQIESGYFYLRRNRGPCKSRNCSGTKNKRKLRNFT